MHKKSGLPASGRGRRDGVIVNFEGVEGLESRRLLSASVGRTIVRGLTYRPSSDAAPTTVALPTHKISAAARKSGLAHTNYLQVLPKGVNQPSAVGSATPVGLTAAQVRHAYGLDTLAFNGITGDGAGQTIAIVDAYDHPGFVSSTDANYLNSDLHKFSVAMGLPDPPSFTKVDQTGGTSYPTTNPGWAAETALDVEWAHALAPKAGIVLVEAASPANYDLISNAVNYARGLPGVSVVSMSFGIDGGLFGESYYDPFFTTPAGHSGVTFVAATGDRGAVLPQNGTGSGTATGEYPAESPNVVAVGGTTLTRDAGGNYAGESAWIGSGGGISNYEAKPIYQSAVTQSSSKRTIPDVSMLADPNTGVAVYDSFNNTSVGGWSNSYFGGTSLAAPLWAGLVAVTNQGRAQNGQATLDGVGQSLPRLYQLPGSTLHDVTTGNNKFDGTHGYNAGVGYDLVTGRGSPIANTLALALAGGSYAGRTFTDTNANGLFDGTDAVLSGVTVYNDVNGNGTLDLGEVSAVSGDSGTYTLDLVGGVAYALREVVPDGYIASPASLAGTTAYGTFGGFDLGSISTTYTAPVGTNTFTLRLDPAGTMIQVFLNTATNGTPTWQIPKASAGSLVLNGNTADDTFVVDLTNGTPLLSGGATFNGLGQMTGDRVRVIANAAGTATNFGDGFFLTNNAPVFTNGVEAYAFAGGAGNDQMEVSPGLASSSPTFTGGGGADGVTVDGGVTYAPPADLGADGTAVTLVAGGSAAVVFGTSQHLAGLTLLNNATASMPGSGHLLRTAALAVASTNGATLDLAANAMIVDYAAVSPATTVRTLLAASYAASAWTGAGLRSSSAAADSSRRHTLGSGEASAVLGLTDSQTGTFMGEPVDATTVLIRYTVYGDATLDGTVGFNDFLIVQGNFGSTGTTFAQGDFNLDGKTDFNDFLSLQTNFGIIA